MFKKLTAIFLTSVMVLSGTVMSFAEDSNEISEVFLNYVKNSGESIIKWNIYKDGDDVTDQYIDTIVDLSEEKDYQSIYDIIVNQNLNISYNTVKVLENGNIKNGVSPYALVTEEHSEYFYNIANSTPSGLRKEWASTVTGRMVVDFNTGTIRSASNPTLDVDANFGSAFDVDIVGISTGRNIYSNRVEFYANYRVEATLGVSIGELPVGFKYKFGSHSNRFSAYPSF